MKTGTILRRVGAFLIALVLCVTIADTASFAKSKAKPTLSENGITMWTNEFGYYISLKNAYAKVTWKSSNQNIAKIEKISGKYGQEVFLKTGNKTGSCKITAKMKHKTYCCKVTVKKGILIQKYSGKKSKNVLEKVTQTKKSIAVRYKMCAAAYNKKKGILASYGHAIRLEKYTDGNWRKADGLSHAPSTCELYVILPKTSVSREVRLESYYDISQLTKGRYRLYVNVFYPDVKAPYVEFELQ